MAATQMDIRGWFARGVEANKKRMLVWCDEYDYEDYPEFTDMTGEELRKYAVSQNGHNMKRLMEVYDLTASVETQMVGRVYNY
jgi:hexokinase